MSRQVAAPGGRPCLSRPSPSPPCWPAHACAHSYLPLPAAPQPQDSSCIGFVFNRRTLCLLFSLLQQLKFFADILRSFVHAHCEYLKSKQNYQWISAAALTEVTAASPSQSRPQCFVKKWEIFERIWAYYRRTTFSSVSVWNKELILFVCVELFKNLEISKCCPSFPTVYEFMWQIFGQARVTENHITIPAFFHFFKSTADNRLIRILSGLGGLLYLYSRRLG